ncbi:PREDICTED: UBX domain-containing protein 1 [Nanorana parkeri]|uniref:UBX domain-containing protein 1 n=1 Tax=Nanorana parkeri TaxID=125878 RepID=UPI0008541613|nr:PREDICTED: UBX domain-containing protein 1 [Nanorana parkeri]
MRACALSASVTWKCSTPPLPVCFVTWFTSADEMSQSSTLESLVEMGFSPSRAEKAVAATGNQGIESAMDWLMEHEDDPDIDETIETIEPFGNVIGSQQIPLPGSFVSFTEEIQGLTEEEREKQTKRMMELIAQKQQEREEREKRERIEQEKQRRKHGQELSVIKQKHQEQEMQKAVEERRREKQEEKLARERVRDKIARDKADRARKYGGETSDPISPPAETPVQASTLSPSSPTQEPPTKKEYDQCRIQVRLLDGTALSQIFRAREQLAAVRLYVELNWPGGPQEPFNLMTSFPRKVFTEEDMEKPLQELGLVPSAVLFVTKLLAA